MGTGMTTELEWLPGKRMDLERSSGIQALGQCCSEDARGQQP